MKTNFFEELSNAEENQHFIKKDKELIEKMQSRVKLEAEKNRLGKESKLAKSEILLQLREMGFKRKTLHLLYLVPLIQVAWSGGTVTSYELKKIIEIAKTNSNISKPEFEQLFDWVNNKPGDEFFDKCLRIIRIILESLDEEEKKASKKDLLSYCNAVALASDSVLGSPRRISDKERTQIEEIAAALEKSKGV